MGFASWNATRRFRRSVITVERKRRSSSKSYARAEPASESRTDSEESAASSRSGWERVYSTDEVPTGSGSAGLRLDPSRDRDLEHRATARRGRHPGQRSLVWGLYHNSIHRIGPGADFFAVYHAGVASKQGLNPYAQDERPRLTPYFYSYRYLPVVGSTLGRLFTTFSPLTAYRLWILVCEAILGLLMWAFWRRFASLPRSKLWGVVTSSILLLSTPYFLELHMGQFTFVMGALCALAML